MSEKAKGKKEPTPPEKTGPKPAGKPAEAAPAPPTPEPAPEGEKPAEKPVEKRKGRKRPKVRKKEKGAYTRYKIDAAGLSRLRPYCERCGPGFFMADHGDRFACGHCGFTRYKRE